LARCPHLLCSNCLLAIMIEDPASAKPEVKRKKFSSGFYIWLFLSIVAYYLDSYLAAYLMKKSIILSVELQKWGIYTIMEVTDQLVNPMVLASIILIYIYSRDVVSSFSIITIYCFSSWVCLFLQLLYTEGRPAFYDLMLQDTTLNCYYGKPIMRLFTQIVVFLWMDNHFDQAIALPKVQKYLIKGFMFFFICVTIFGFLYLGANGIHQIILTIVFAFFYFAVHQKVENWILHNILLPILEKDKLMEKKAIIYILSLITVMNGIILVLWNYKFTKFENLENEKFKFKNCIECLAEINTNFSTKMITQGLLYNLLFGMFLGVYTLPEKVFEFERYVADERPRMIIYRQIFTLLFVLPLALLYFPKFKNPYASILKSFLSSLFVGFLLTNAMMRIMRQISESKEEFSEAAVQFFTRDRPEESRIALSVRPDLHQRDFYV